MRGKPVRNMSQIRLHRVEGEIMTNYFGDPVEACAGKQVVKHETWELRQMQALPLDIKVKMTQRRIRDWYNYWGGEVYISFSGGKDSTVLLHIAREIFPDITAVFVNTGLEYPEIRKFAKSFENVEVIYPKMSFDEVIRKFGYPVLSKTICHKISFARKGSQWALKFVNGTAVDDTGRKSMYNIEKYKPMLNMDFGVSDLCCDIMKKAPGHEYEKRTGKKRMTAQMACESKMRTQQWLFNGCNGFDMKSPVSNPMSFWTEQDVLQYIVQNDIPLASVYGEIEGASPQMCLFGDEKLRTTGCERTGCIFCGFGCHLEKESRFVRLRQTHPRQYEYCIGGGGYDTDGIWKPNSSGLGMGHVFDELNKVYGKDFIKY